tara:strand:+ start:235 stop:444 length:210 start_codon:yes stop_codon:yes gene_type:complete
MISKQKRNLIHELSFWILQEIEEVNNSEKTTEEKKININQLINILKYNRCSSNKYIKELINELKYQLPF